MLAMPMTQKLMLQLNLWELLRNHKGFQTNLKT